MSDVTTKDTVIHMNLIKNNQINCLRKNGFMITRRLKHIINHIWACDENIRRKLKNIFASKAEIINFSATYTARNNQFFPVLLHIFFWKIRQDRKSVV